MISGLEAKLRAALGSGGINLMPRALPAEIQKLIDAVERLPAMSFVGRPEVVAYAVRASMRQTDLAPPLVDWLSSDVEDLATAFASVVGVSLVGIQLAAAIEDRSSRVDPGNLGHRLLTTYRGVGTEWLPPRVLAFVPPGWPLPGDVKGYRRQAAASMPGDGQASDGGPRRSPHDGFGISRHTAPWLFLSIDDYGNC